MSAAARPAPGSGGPARGPARGRHGLSRRGLLAGTAAALALDACGRARRRSGPSVLLISLDSTRRDLLSCYGHREPHAPDVPTSPAIDRLASEGVQFQGSRSTTSWTLPAHMTVLTGEPELVHAVDLDHHRPAAGVRMLAERLRSAGYRTAGFFSGPYLEPQFGFGRGFQRYEACYGPALSQASARAAELRARHEAAAGTGDRRQTEVARQALAAAEADLQLESHRDVSSPVVEAHVLEELERAAREGGPFFLFAHFFDPHYDYAPPAPFDRRFDPDWAGDADWSDLVRNPAISRPDPEGDFGERVRVVDDRGLENIRSRYAGELAWTDAAVGRILARLDTLGLAADTLVVLLADHGDEFFEHRGIGHRRTLYEEVVQVPLVLRLPGVLPAGRRVAGLASTVRVVPTVLDLLGLPGAGEAPLGGSLAPRARDEDAPEETGAPGRFVQLVPARFTLHAEDGAGVDTVVEVRQVRLDETWVDGDLKLLRRARWLEPVLGASADAAARVRALRGRDARQEEVLWIDLARYPAEPLERYSRDFGDPRAAAALARWRDVYGRLLARRGEAEVATDAGGLETQLQALGYAGGADGKGGAFGSAALTLPPP